MVAAHAACDSCGCGRAFGCDVSVVVDVARALVTVWSRLS